MTARKAFVWVAGSIVSLSIGASASAAVQVGQSGWTWSNPQPQGRRILDLANVDANRGYAAGMSGTLLTTADAGATWQSIPTGFTADLTRVAPVGVSSVVAIGSCLARRSDDNGVTLTRLAFTANDRSCSSPVVATSFPSPSVAICCWPMAES